MTRFWCAHEYVYVERTHHGQQMLECVGCGKMAQEVQRDERQRLEALVRMGSRRSATLGH